MRYRPGLSACCALLFVAGVSCAAEFNLRDEKLVKTPEGREQLKYLVGCALAPEDSVTAQAGNLHYVFHGSMGLAPGWATRPLNDREQRMVSACIFARTNYFGVPVQISMRSDAADAPESLRSDSSEQRDYPFFEGGFFGNLFLEKPEAYVCTGDDSPARMAHLRALLRVCSLPLQQQHASLPVSQCHFVIAGACSMRAFHRNGVDYSSEVLKVYLPGRK
jgi:hypothetical protein